ncbi:hypothetical protein AK812_SmicGene25248 [Symbiodinium microadriaticum]|uniref:Uncharacterized protein n=1 Tax=Symbiodinium microadriaticum TaxID=2951 RepID=A0A1Q9DCJ5_SYMMI|nr:hypothetical protein AK812_SmicGene25248 [Symbiodinium microadriaticum]
MASILQKYNTLPQQVRAYAACTRAVIEEAEWEVSALYNTKDGQRLLTQSFSANGDAQVCQPPAGTESPPENQNQNKSPKESHMTIWASTCGVIAVLRQSMQTMIMSKDKPGEELECQTRPEQPANYDANGFSLLYKILGHAKERMPVVLPLLAEDDEDGTLMDGDAQDSLEADGTDADVATDTMFEHHEEEDEEGAEEEDEEEEAEEEMHEEAESEQGEQEAVLPVEAAEEPASTPRAAKALEPAAGGQVEPARGLRGRLSRPTKKRQ